LVAVLFCNVINWSEVTSAAEETTVVLSDDRTTNIEIGGGRDRTC
jgi:hypothetical protein